ncbi:MAG: HAD hydrolase-like protein [Magnetococcales bacterium]|nr:HAD hydrolase-like protein [Magnetococcales bacterium]
MKPILQDQQGLLPHYAAYRAHLCQADAGLDERLRAGRMQRVRFASLAQSYDLLLLDAFGVLYRGAQVIEGAPAALAALRQAGRTWRVLSNNASQSPEQLARQLTGMGFSIHPSELLTSGMAIRPFVAASPFCGLPYYWVGTTDSMADYGVEPERLCVNRWPGDGWQQARYILLCSNRGYYGSPAQTQVEWLLDRQPLPILLANPDLVTPERGGGVSVVAGYTAAQWVERFHCERIGLGKPFAPLYALLRHHFPHLEPARCLMVGDTLDTDILGGAAQGFATCLTLSGAYAEREEELEAICAQRGIRADFVVRSIAD